MADATTQINPTVAAAQSATTARKRFTDPVADLLGQIMPHLQRVVDDTRQAADNAAIAHARGGGKDAAQLDQAVKLYARCDRFGEAVTLLLADPLLPQEFHDWWTAQAAPASA